MSSLLLSSINLVILVGFLVYKLRQPVREYVALRTRSIHDEVQSVGEMLKEAERKYEEFSRKLEEVDQEIQGLKAQTHSDIASMKQRFSAEILNLKRTVIEDAKVSSTALIEEFRREIYLEFTEKVLERGEILIQDRLTGEDRARMRQEFSRQLEAV